MSVCLKFMDHSLSVLQLSDTHSSLIWCTSPSHTQSLLEMSPERFVDAVNSAFVS